MEEAYEIGVRLVLDDAVTPALAKIERQLAQFDAADAGMAGFARLPPAPAPVPPATLALPDLPVPVAQPVTAMPRAEAPALPPLALPPLPAPIAPVVALPVVEMVALPPVALPGAAAPALPRIPSGAGEAPAQPAAPVSLDFALFAPRQAAAEMVQPVVAPLQEMALPQMPAAAFAPLPEAPQAPAMAPAMREGAQAASVATQPSDAAPPTSPASAMPQAAAGGTVQIRGDVTLDGRRVGTWMSEEFALMAEGPQAGTSFFDPRAGAAWPGTMQGA